MTIKLNDGFKAPMAVVDWVAFTVELERKSHGGYLKNKYAHLGVSHAIPLNKGHGGAANRFLLRLQHPTNYEVIKNLVSKLKSKYGFTSEPVIRGLEVSIDFYHESSDLAALESMTERLMLSITPPKVSNPRIIGKGDMLFSKTSLPKCSIDTSKTLYIGNKWDDLMWRVYFKRTDDSFIGEDNKRVTKPLAPDEFRCRVEVRLKREALKQLSLSSITDLQDFPYHKLYSAGLFKFANRKHLMFTNKFSNYAAKSLGIDNNSPACILNRFGRKDIRWRERELSRHLVTDNELAEATRQALRRLTQRF